MTLKMAGWARPVVCDKERTILVSRCTVPIDPDPVELIYQHRNAGSGYEGKSTYHVPSWHVARLNGPRNT